MIFKIKNDFLIAAHNSKSELIWNVGSEQVINLENEYFYLQRGLTLLTQ